MAKRAFYAKACAVRRQNCTNASQNKTPPHDAEHIILVTETRSTTFSRDANELDAFRHSNDDIEGLGDGRNKR